MNIMKIFFLFIYSSKLKWNLLWFDSDPIYKITKKKKKYTLFQIKNFIIYYY